jgi:hypothetical protein
MPSGLRERVLAAYGGEARWRAAQAAEVTVDVGGPLFLWKRGGGFPNQRVRAEIARPRVRLDPVDRQGRVGRLDGHTTALESADGRLLEERPEARGKFHGRRQIYWDALDMVYFFGYAMWNYITFPALLLRDDIEWRQVGELSLEARFPAHLPTHCPVQQYHFDPATALLQRNDYTAEVFGSWATAAHLVLEHTTVDGVPFASKRRVRPLPADGKVKPITLIWIELRDFKLN